MLTAIAIGSAMLVLPAISSVHSPSTTVAGSTFDNLVVILMENHGLSDIIGSANYMTTLSNTYGLARSYTAVSHPSEPNYCALIGAEFNYCGSDGICCGQDPGANIVDRLESAGLTWIAYAEDASGSGTCSFSPPRGGDHFPFLDFADIQTKPTRCSKFQATTSSSDPEFLSALSSPSTAPNLLWLTPNDCNNMHDCSVDTGDAYLAGLVPKILASATFTTNRAALFIVFDEGNGSYPSDYVYAAWAGPVVKPAHSSSSQYSHYSFARTLEANWNLPTLTVNDADAASMAEFFATTPTPPGPLSTSVTANTSIPLVNAEIAFDAKTTGGVQPYTDRWSFGDGMTATGPHTYHKYSSAGVYTVKETASDSGSPVNTAVANLTLTVEPLQWAGQGSFNSSWYLSTLAPSTSAVVNGVLETRQSNPNATDYVNSYYDTAQVGKFPWQGNPGSAQPLQGSNITVGPVNFLSRSLLSGSRYHIYIGLYYWLPNGAIQGCNATLDSIGCRTYQWFDTQVRCAENINGIDSAIGTTDTYDPGDSFGWDIVRFQVDPGQTCQLSNWSVEAQFLNAASAWGINPNTPHQLMGIEVGTEGYSFISVNVDWYNAHLAGSTPTLQPLSASFSYSPIGPRVGQTVTLNGTATGGSQPYNYTWDLGDGTYGGGAFLNHVYLSAGNYTVKLTVKDSVGSVSTSRTINVSMVPHLSGDVNGDCVVDLRDLLILVNSYGKSIGDTGFDARADINHDGIVNILDVAIAAYHYGQKC